MITRLRWCLPGCALLIASACSFDNTVPNAATVSCVAGHACPAGNTCVASIDRCVPNADLTGPVVEVVTPTVAPARGNLGATFTLSFNITQSLFSNPRATAQTFDPVTGSPLSFPFACGACQPGPTCTCTLQLPAQPQPPDGSYAVELAVTDTSGNVVGPAAAGTFILDTTPPALEGPVSLSIVAASSTVTTPVSQLGPLSVAELCFQVDEALGTPPLLISDPTGLTFAEETGFPTPDQQYCFTGSNDGGAPDGVATIAVELTDLVGNAATVKLLSTDAGLVLKSTLPVQPDLLTDGGLYLHRAPWGEPPPSALRWSSCARGRPRLPSPGS